GPCKAPTCAPDTGQCHEENRTAGAACDPKTACMGPGVCDDQGACLGAPVPNGDNCTMANGALGLCLAGVCAALDQTGSDPGAGGAKPTGAKAGCGCATVPAGGGAALVLIAAAVALARRRRRS